MRSVLAALTLLVLLGGMVLPVRAEAHGVRRVHYESTAFVVEVSFSDGTAASYAEVLVFAPENSDVEFQNGRTDAKGRFAFLPDRPGNWLVRVNAGMGHGFDMEIEVLPGQVATP
ncbi:MAG: hypothetical protein V3573_09010 [Desulfovibrionaceae bacterium]